MVRIQAIVLLLFLLMASVASAEGWGFAISRAGYLGDAAVGGFRDWYNTHIFDFSLGTYKVSSSSYIQVNVGYRYNPWEIIYKDFDWNPLQMGFYGFRSLDDTNYFRRSPSKYPTADYYDETAFRLGFMIGTEIKKENWSLSYFVMNLDNGIIAYYNNPKVDYIRYFLSHGMTLRYHF